MIRDWVQGQCDIHVIFLSWGCTSFDFIQMESMGIIRTDIDLSIGANRWIGVNVWDSPVWTP